MADRSETEFEDWFQSVWNEEICPNGETFIPENNVKIALDISGYRLPNHKVRELLAHLKKKGDINNVGKVTKDEFKQICLEQKMQEWTRDWKTTKGFTDDEVIRHKSDRSGDSYHLILIEEQRSFSNWINENLSQFVDLQHLLPLKEDGADLYDKIKDGILLCKLINFAVPDTIDQRVINFDSNLSLFKKHENLTLAITSAQAIGCTVINMNSHVLTEGRKHIILGLLWQIIARFLFDRINLQHVPGLVSLLKEGETAETLLKLSPEQILIRWVNHQLEKSGVEKKINNFSNDIMDSEAYVHLIKQIAPKTAGVNTTALQERDLTERAKKTLEQAEKIHCRAFVTAFDIVKGVEKLNLAFVANLFNQHPALNSITETEEDLEKFQETREEKMFRNWMNSLGVKPHVNYLYTDLYNGLIMFQIYDIIQPGIVNWKRVVQKDQFSKIRAKWNIQILENCNYAVELGKKLNFILVGIEGNDIMTGNKTLTLGLVWQLMRKYTLSLLAKLSPDGTPIVESEILSWANQKLSEANKGVLVRHFQDKVNRTALPVIHLIDSINRGIIDYTAVRMDTKELIDVDCMANAMYAITMARKIGAGVYALPEDLVEVKHKMVMTVYAALMLIDMKDSSINK